MYFILSIVNDAATSLQHVHSFGLVYKDLISDNIALYQDEGCHVHAVTVDFGKCLHISSCTTYSLTPSKRVPDVPWVASTHFSRSCWRYIKTIHSQWYLQPRENFKHTRTIPYGTVELKLWPKSVIHVCKQCLSHLPSTKPAISEIIHILKWYSWIVWSLS